MGFNVTPIVLRLILLNVVLLLLPYLLGYHGLVISLLGMYYPESSYFQPWQVVSYLFIHSDFYHLLSNMLGLFIFGPLLEQIWGTRRFLIYYLACGIGAGLIYQATAWYELSELKKDAIEFQEEPNPENFSRFFQKHNKAIYQRLLPFVESFDENASDERYIAEASKAVLHEQNMQLNRPLVGASGAIMGILIAFGLLFPNAELMLLFPPIPIKAKYLVGAYALWDLYRAFQNAPDDHVAHYAHLGGMLIGAIIVLAWNKNRERFY